MLMYFLYTIKVNLAVLQHCFFSYLKNKGSTVKVRIFISLEMGLIIDLLVFMFVECPATYPHGALQHYFSKTQLIKVYSMKHVDTKYNSCLAIN